MIPFHKFSDLVTAQLRDIFHRHQTQGGRILRITYTGDQLWDTYLSSFPEGTNPMFRERTEHDCSCCKSFIRNVGGLVYIDPAGVRHSIWDQAAREGRLEFYMTVAHHLALRAHMSPIEGLFATSEPKYGAASNVDEEGTTWNHFHVDIPRGLQYKVLTPRDVGEALTSVNVFQRSLEEITPEAIEIVLDLINSGTLYKGPEFRGAVEALAKHQAAYEVFENSTHYLWLHAGMNTRYRNTVIGTLLSDISEGHDLEDCVKAYEAKTAPANYKRPSALITQKMIDAAQATTLELGLEDSLHRRYAIRSDISAANTVWVDGEVRPKLLGGAFDNITPTKKSAAPTLDRVEDIPVQEFIDKVLPGASSVELFLENSHTNRFVSLIAPVVPDAEPIFKWGNLFSWSYAGEVTDSIKERVKRAGGNVAGALRVSLSWHNSDDLDLHVYYGNEHVYYGNEHVYYGNRHAFGAALDVDMNAGWGQRNDKDPVENVTWGGRVLDGSYWVTAHTFNQRGRANQGFEIEIENQGRVWTAASHTTPAGHSDEVTITVMGGVVTEVTGATEGSASREEWGVTTESWVPVDIVTHSPNFWDGETVGHQHLFFFLRGCKSPLPARGFYNEFLDPALTPHRKVFEVLASKMKAQSFPEQTQLSGVGFSRTDRSSVKLRVKGATHRVFNVLF